MPFPGRIVAPRNWGLLRSADCGLSKITAGSPPMEIGVDSAAREPALAARGLERCPEEAWTATTAAASTRIKINPCFVIESSFSAENVYLTRSVTNCDMAAIFENLIPRFATASKNLSNRLLPHCVAYLFQCALDGSLV